jgi:predicted nuclease of restriction endonuclease-like RecB superfamily
MRKGSFHTEESKKIIGISGIGRVPWNKGQTKDSNKSIERYAKKRIGIKFSKEHIKNLSLSHVGKRLSKEAIDKVRKYNKTRCDLGIHQFQKKENIEKFAKMTKDRWLDDSFRKTMCKVISESHIGVRPTKEQNIKNAISQFYRLKRQPGGFGPYNGIMFRSSWEVVVAKKLDTLGVEWEYEPEYFVVGDFVYIPDFKINHGSCYVEVKGHCFTTRQIKKMQDFIESGKNLIIIDGHNIELEKEWGVI